MLLNLIMVIIAILISVPLMVIAIELFITLFSKAKALEVPEFQGAYQILMPAHNEAEIINQTLADLLEASILPSSILIVADNCTDNTAEIARELGVTVIERLNETHRGKGFALDYGINYLKDNSPPNILIILDSDCQISSESLNVLASMCKKEDRPTQALYLMRHGSGASLKQRVASFAWLVKNKVRPIAVNKLGLPVTLTGTGMAFPWHVIADINVAHGNIVEDMQLGIDCTLNGFSPVFCEQAVVYSDFPDQVEAEQTQRTRWEHGHLLTIVQQVPILLKQAIFQKDWRLFGLALDVGVPPISLLVLLSFSCLALFTIVSYAISSFSALYILFPSVLIFSGMLIVIWYKFGRDYLTLKDLLSIPLYVIFKISIYVTFVFKRQKDWIRTNRIRK
mgnify:CR=1 FL=1